MFYDFFHLTFDARGDMVDEQGSVVVPNELQGRFQQALLRQASRRTPDLRQNSHLHPSATPSVHHFNVGQRTSDPRSYLGPPHTAASRTSPTPTAPHFAAQPNWPPPQNHPLPRRPAFPAQTRSYLTVPADGDLWSRPSVSPGLRNLSPLHHPPTIRLPTDELQDYFSTISPGSSFHRSDDYCDPDYIDTDPNIGTVAFQHNNPSLRFPYQNFMTSALLGDMNTPASSVSPRPHSSHDTNGDQFLSQLMQASRKRSFSDMSPSEPTQLQQTEDPYHRPSSVVSTAHEATPPAEEPKSTRGLHVYTRGDPPMNADNKIYCDWSPECSDRLFERKCEWSKHMDKHDRPYRCQLESCAKLQGFTYCGGLLRHEREVHGKHGGPRGQLFCPHGSCKRHAGKGFTRKENLNEHLRRVHEVRPSDQPSQNDMSGQETMEIMQGAVDEVLETSASDLVEPDDIPDDIIESLPFARRKRSLEAVIMDPPVGDIDMLHHQIKRLRAENEAKDDRLRMLEEAEVARRQELDQLRAAMAQIQQSRAVQSLQHAQD